MASSTGSGAGNSSGTTTSGGTSAPAGSAPAGNAGRADRNSVQQGRPRERKGRAKPQASEEGRPAREARRVNSISAPRVRGATVGERFDTTGGGRFPPDEKREAKESRNESGQKAREPEREAPAPGEDLSSVPDHIRQRFVQVGRKYYFPDGARAFTDRGRRLTTPSENTEVIRSLVTIARARGWNEIVVRGTNQFRREAWFAAQAMGLEVRGYRPTDFEQARLVRTLAARQKAPEKEGSAEAQPPQGRKSAKGSDASPRESGRESRTASTGQELITGRLIEHGPAPFQHDPHEAMSYFARIQTPKGERTVWGVDLGRAFTESQTRPKQGDEIGLQPVGREQVTVKAPRRDGEGKVVGERDLDTHRNRWIVEKREFFESRKAAAETVRDTRVPAREAVKSHPELVGTYLQIRAAELAAKHFKDPKDQERFVSTVRSKLADTVARGERAPAVKLRERAVSRPPRTRTTRTPEQAPARG